MKNTKKMISLFLSILIMAGLCLSGCSVNSIVESTVDEVQKKLIGDKTLYVETISADKYAYQTLSDTQKLVYDEILYAFMHRESDIQIATTDIEEMELAYRAIRYDYCNLFWVDKLNYVTYKRDDTITAIEISPTFLMSEEEQNQIQTQIDQEADRMLEGAPWAGSDFDKALYVYETLINEVDYVEGSEHNQNIISVFLNHETICQGYTYGTQYLLEKLGIPCISVTGNVKEGEKHAWNLVQLDGDYYYIDTTWGNSQYSYQNGEVDEELAEELATSNYLDYNYFGVTTEDLVRTHILDPEIPLPECTATDNNYFIHEGWFVDEWDSQNLGQKIKEAYQSGDRTIRIKFSNEELYEQAEQYYIEDAHIFDYFSDMESLRYLENVESCVLVLLFPED